VRAEVLLDEDHGRNPRDGGGEATGIEGAGELTSSFIPNYHEDINDLTRVVIGMCRCAGSVLVAIAFCLGCSDADLETSDVKFTSAKAAGAKTIEFSVPDMMCEDGCAVAVKQILSKQSGAKGVLVDFDAKTATVAVEEGTFDSQQALAALVDKGFDHSSLVDGAAVKPPAAAGAAVQ
jgi:copper chaperone CopZ